MSDTDTPAPAIADTAAPPPAPVQTPAPQAPAFDGPEWLAQYPDDVKADRSLWKYSNGEAATRALISAQRMIGMEKVPRPKGEFDPSNKDWEPWLNAMGRPASADEYKFDEAKLPEGLAYDKALEGKFKDMAHLAGLTNKQAAMVRDMFAAYQVDSYTGAQTEYSNKRAEAEAELQKELGSAYEPYVNASKAALKQYASPAFVAMLEESGLGNHPEMIRVFGKIGKETLGDTQLQGRSSDAFKSPADWAREASAYQAANSAALYTAGHPDQARVHAEWTRLMNLAYPEKSQP